MFLSVSCTGLERASSKGSTWHCQACSRGLILTPRAGACGAWIIFHSITSKKYRKRHPTNTNTSLPAQAVSSALDSRIGPQAAPYAARERAMFKAPTREPKRLCTACVLRIPPPRRRRAFTPSASLLAPPLHQRYTAPTLVLRSQPA
jgi:hypothetical protein